MKTQTAVIALAAALVAVPAFAGHNRPTSKGGKWIARKASGDVVDTYRETGDEIGR